MDRYVVYLYNIPKVSEDGKSEIPTDPSQTKDLESQAEASRVASEHKDAFDRVVVIRVRALPDGQGEEQKMLERYRDGKHEVFPEEPEQQEAASAPA